MRGVQLCSALSAGRGGGSLVGERGGGRGEAQDAEHRPSVRAPASREPAWRGGRGGRECGVRARRARRPGCVWPRRARSSGLADAGGGRLGALGACRRPLGAAGGRRAAAAPPRPSGALLINCAVLSARGVEPDPAYLSAGRARPGAEGGRGAGCKETSPTSLEAAAARQLDPARQ